MKKFADYVAEAEQTLAEKAVSQQQQKFMGMVHAMQKGEKVKGASPELKKVARTMKKKDAKDFAKTKHKGLPKKVGETVTEATLVAEAGDHLDHILSRFKHEVKNFVEDGELDSNLYDALFDHYSNAGEMPYGVAKARTGDPYDWISEKLYDHLHSQGLVEVSDPLEIPAYKRKHSARLGNFPAPLAPKMDAPSKFKIRPEEIPAVQRKAAGKNFPATLDQVHDTSDKISSLDTLRKMAGLPPRV